MNRSRRPALYTPRGVAVGTLLGSLAAAAVLLWINYRALGHTRLANKVAAAGLLAYLAIITVASLLPNNLPLAVGFIALQTGLAYWAAEALQGTAVRYHLTQGGRAHSLVWAAGVGLLAGLGVVLVLLTVSSVMGVEVFEVPRPGTLAAR
jgi:hypothetical protein